MNSLNNSCQDINIQYSLVKHLKLHSESDDKYKSLYASWIIDEKVYTNALTAVANSFPHYSMHDSSHSWSIINKIEMVLGEKRIKKLSPTDTFLILETAFVHDLGMIISEDDQKKLWAELEFKKYIEDIINNNYDQDLVTAAKYIQNIQENGVGKNNDWPLEVKKFVTILNADYFRRVHNYRSSDVIMNSNQIDVLSNRNNLIQERIMRLVAQISIMHGTNFNDILEKLNKEDIGVGTDQIHPRMIACLLRLGDLLDLDNGRFNDTLSKTIFMPKTSKDHKEKHQAITHFLVSPERIEVSAICPNDGVYRATRQWFEWLQEELKNLSSRWSDIVPDDFIGGPPSLGDIKLSIKDDNGITEQLNFKFNIEQKVAFEFIEGAGVYKNKLDCLREVIQNALDATKIQMWNDIKYEKYDLLNGCIDISKEKLNFSSDIPLIIKQLYPIKIKLKDAEEDSEHFFEIEIEDSGCGISLTDLKRMESVGNSWSKDIKMYEKIELMEDWMKPTGSFGIGLHSLFMITDRVEIETKSENGDAYDIIFISSKNNGYISTKINNERRKIGTKVKFQFSSDVLKGIEMHELESNIFQLASIQTKRLDIVDPNYEYKRNKEIICAALNNYIDNVNWIKIKREGILKVAKISNSNLIDVSGHKNGFIKIDDLEIEVGIDDELNTIYANVKDLSNYTEIYFSLLSNEDDQEKINYSLILGAINLDGSLFDKIDIYYKDIFCTEIWNHAIFNTKINFVMGRAKHLLSVNRNSFRNTSIIENYIQRINSHIIDKVINQMWRFITNNYKSFLVINNYILNTNIVLIGLYYKKYCDNKFDLNLLNNNPIFYETIHKEIKKLKKDAFENAALKELINEEKILLTVNYYYEVEKIANENDIEIIIDNLQDLEDCTNENGIRLLNFNNIEYITDRIYIAYKDNKERDFNLVILDYFKSEAVSNFLYNLFNTNTWNYELRKSISSFEYKNKVDSNIKYLITNNNTILSPFIGDLDEQIFEKNIDDCIKELKEKWRFNELIEYVYKNSLNKASIEEIDCKENIENAYKELIVDYIDFVYKKDKISIVEKEVSTDVEK